MFPTHYFERDDDSDDSLFYTSPRLVVHLDDGAIRATTELYRQHLPQNGEILDLMSSWRSHLPSDVQFKRVVGLGMNEVELRENPQLSDYVVQNLNQDPRLPFAEASFDGCVLTVSVQYLTNPIGVFREVGRVLRAGAPFLTVFSNRMFPTKAVAIWRNLDDAGHVQLVNAYYTAAGQFERVEPINARPRQIFGDPLYAVIGRKRGPVGDQVSGDGGR